MTDDLEASIIRDLLGSGTADGPGTPNPQGVTPEEIASSIPYTPEEVEKKLKKLSSFEVSPVEKCGPRRYRLEGISEGRKALRGDYSKLPPEAWPALSDKEEEGDE